VADWQDGSSSGLRIVDAIGGQFARLEQEANRASVKRRFLRPLALAFGGLLVIAAGAGAAIGALSVGSVIPAGEDPGFEHRGPSPKQTVLARGTTPVGGPWQLTTYRSAGVVDEQGESLEARGLPCIRLLLTAPPSRNPINGSAFCLAPGKPDFNASSIPVLDESSRKNELIIYGFAPTSAAAVQLTAAGGKTIRSDTEPGEPEFPGKIWVIAAAPGLEDAELDWVDRTGNQAEAKLDASRHFDQLEAVTD
jgi:hypothetical protein